MVGIISVVIGDHFGGGDHFNGGDQFGGGTLPRASLREKKQKQMLKQSTVNQ